MSTVLDLIIALQSCFFENQDMRRALYVLAVLPTLYPLLWLHRNQTAQPRQPEETGWLKLIWQVLYAAFHPEKLDPTVWSGTGPGRHAVERIYHHIDNLCDYLDLHGQLENFVPPLPLFRTPPFILSTTRKDCAICPIGPAPCTLRKKVDGHNIRLIGADGRSSPAYLIVAHCPQCDSNHYPDHITFKSDSGRQQKLEIDSPYLRVSKHGVWAVRDLAIAQEKAVYRFHAGFFNFAEWVNDCSIGTEENGLKTLTVRQSQKMFTEHLSRRLIQAHGMQDTFQCPANPSANSLAGYVRDALGKDGGLVAGSMEHGCVECTHKKRYRSDLATEGVDFNQQRSENQVAGDDLNDNVSVNCMSAAPYLLDPGCHSGSER